MTARLRISRREHRGDRGEQPLGRAPEREAHRLEKAAPHHHHSSPARICSFRKSVVRHAIARIDHVVFCVPPHTNGAASARYTFFTSCRRQKRSVTLVFGSFPMRAVPISWI